MSTRKSLIRRSFEVTSESMNDGTSRAIIEGDILYLDEIPRADWLKVLSTATNKVFVIDAIEWLDVVEVVEHDIETGRIKCHCWNPEPEYEDLELLLNDVRRLLKVTTINRFWNDTRSN